MTESSRSGDDRVARPVRRHLGDERLSSGTATLVIAALSLLCWAILILIGLGLWSALG